jgi:hypothetical protein
MRGEEDTRDVIDNSNDSTVLRVNDPGKQLFLNFQEVRETLSDPAIEDVLFEANALTSVIVDCIHGVLPSRREGNAEMEVRIVDLIDRLLLLSKKRSKQASRLELHECKWKEILDDDEQEIVEEVTFQIWHEISHLRRILARILKAVQSKAHLDALSRGDTRVELETINAFCELKNDFDALILHHADTIFRRLDLNNVNWYDFAVIYEATLVYRARREEYPALLMAEKAEKLHLDESGYVPKGSEIRGLISFNPNLFCQIQISESSTPEFYTPQKVLFSISKAITLNSKGAASQSVTQFYDDDWLELLEVIRDGLHTYIDENKEMLHHSSLLHIESTLRVICHNLINETRSKSPRKLVEEEVDEEEGEVDEDEQSDIWSTACELSIQMNNVYKLLKEVLAEKKRLDPWIKQMVQAKMTQDGGILFSNLVPVVFLELTDIDEKTYVEMTGKDMKELNTIAREISTQLEHGWDKWEDCPARIRKKFRSAITKDLSKRADDLHSEIELPHLTDLIGDPTAMNPFTTRTGRKEGSLSSWFWGVGQTSRSDTSRHLRHFPQSHINKAQISVLMAYMQLLEKQSNRVGFFEDIDEMLVEEDEERQQWRCTPSIEVRPQFTIGHLKKELNQKHITQIDSYQKRGKKKVKNFARSNVTRVNRMDPLMFAATSMNFIEDLIKKEVSNEDKVLFRLDKAARQCRLPGNDHLRVSEAKVHVHDMIHAAQEAAQSPMRVVQHHLDSSLLEKSELIDQILRVSFSRLYILTARVEQLARILLECPLRQPYQDSSVLLIDQVRVLLKFMHTEWLKGEAKEFEKRDALPDVFIDRSTVECFNQLKKSKGHLGIYFPKEKYLDRKNSDFIKEDIALEYALSNGLPRRGSETKTSMRDIVEKNHQRLSFTNIFHISWEDFLRQSLNSNYDGPYVPRFEEDKEDKQSHPLIQESFKSIKDKDAPNREWILWSRLAFFPVCFNGRTIVSSTTFSKNSSDQDSEVSSRLWGKLKEAYLSNSGVK